MTIASSVIPWSGSLDLVGGVVMAAIEVQGVPVGKAAQRTLGAEEKMLFPATFGKHRGFGSQPMKRHMPQLLGLAALAWCIAQSAVARALPVDPAQTEASAPQGRDVEVEELNLAFSARGKPLPVPLIQATVAGKEVLLLLDTGATHSVLGSDFVRKQGLARSGDTQGEGHIGEKVELGRLAPVDLGVGHTTRHLEDLASTDVPSAFGPLGIAGFLSPQTFFTEGCLVFDFPAGKLYVLKCGFTEARAWLASRHPGSRIADLRRVPDNEGRRLLLSAAVAGRPPVTALLDTGGSHTEFAPEYLGVSDAAPGDTGGISVSGKAVQATSVPGQQVELGGLLFGPMTLRSRVQKPGRQALIGMDLLRSTVLLVPCAERDTVALLQPSK